MTFLRIRGMLGILIATLVAILFLKYADTQNPLAEPSHLYQGSNHYLPTGLPWWVGAGLIIGVVIGLSLFRYVRQLQQGVINTTVTTVLVALILSLFAFDGYAITLPTYLLVSAFNVIVLLIVTALPAAAGVVVVTLFTTRTARRSTWDIMPDELKAEMRQKQATQPHKSLLSPWPRHSHEDSKS